VHLGRDTLSFTRWPLVLLVSRARACPQSPPLPGTPTYLEEGGWPVNIYGIPDLEAFLEASLLLPRSVADFNFPNWHYFGRGSGQHRAYHRYEFARNALAR